LAQQAPPPAASLTPLDAVTTTATRTPQVAGDVAAPVTVVPREELRRRQPGSLNDILQDIPSVEADGLPRASVQQPQIRGLGDDRVVIQLDGVRQNFNAGHRGRFFFEPELLRQVDVLRGPASQLYGSGALGGVIALRTIEAEDLIRPGRATGFFLSQGYDTNGGRWRSAAGAAFQAGQFDGIVAYARNAGNNLTDGLGQTIPFTDPTTNTVMARLGWNPLPGMRISASVLHRDEQQIIPVAANTITNTNIADRSLQATQFALNFAYAPPQTRLVDVRATLYRNQVGITERRIIPNDGRRETTDLETWGLTLQNTARFSLAGWDRHALTAGFDGYIDEQIGRSGGAVRGGYPEARQEVFGFFVQDELNIGPVTIIGGLRYDRFDSSSPGRAGNTNDRVSPRISAAYRITDWLQPYIAYAEAYRAPNLTQLYNTGVHFPLGIDPRTRRPIFNVFVPNPNLRPETSRNTELGVNLRFRDVIEDGDSLRVRASIFRNNLSDFIETIVTSTTTEQRNVTRARIDGFELEGQYESRLWFARAGASILQGDNRTNQQPLSLIPAHKLSLTLGRRFVEQGLTLGGRVQLVAEQDRKPRDPATGLPRPRTEPYALMDLFLTWQPPEGPLAPLRFDFGVANLMDVRYRRPSWDAGVVRSSFYDVGRNVQFRISAQF
jgi:hemoglobin/transferrin/lactoferrin receptor protein